MILVVLMVLIKTLSLLRIFPTLTPIVIMIQTVVFDLKIFLFFYMILIFGFCQVYAVLGLGQKYAPEYDTIGLHPGQFLWTLRLSMGDFSAIPPSKELTSYEQQIFWIMWLFSVIITCIIFLNFVVAEACASYTKVIT